MGKHINSTKQNFINKIMNRIYYNVKRGLYSEAEALEALGDIDGLVLTGKRISTKTEFTPEMIAQLEAMIRTSKDFEETTGKLDLYSGLKKTKDDFYAFFDSLDEIESELLGYSDTYTLMQEMGSMVRKKDRAGAQALFDKIQKEVIKAKKKRGEIA